MTKNGLNLDPADPQTVRLLEAGLMLAKHLAFTAAVMYYPQQADLTTATELWSNSDPTTRHMWRMRAMEFIRGLDPKATERVVTTGFGGKVIGRIGVEE